MRDDIKAAFQNPKFIDEEYSFLEIRDEVCKILQAKYSEEVIYQEIDNYIMFLIGWDTDPYKGQ
jgi:hypothetical protein